MAKKMAKKPVKRKYTKRHKKGSRLLPFAPFSEDALFTMVLSMQTFATQTLGKAKVKVNSAVLLEKLSAALIDTIYAADDKPIYNVAADAIAAAFLTHKRGDKKASASLIALAFESPDCETLLESLVAVNAKSIGVKLTADDMSDSGNVGLDTDNSPPPEGDLDMANNMEDSGGDGGDVSTTPSIMSSQKSFKKRFRSLVKSASDDYQINYGIDGPQGDTDDDLDTFVDDGAEQLLEVEPLGAGDDSIPDTMRLGIPTDINELVGEYPDDLPKVEMLSAKRVAKLAKDHPDIISISNKIAVVGGNVKGKKLAHRFMRQAINQ